MKYILRHKAKILTLLSYATLVSRYMPRTGRVMTVLYLAGMIADIVNDARGAKGKRHRIKERIQRLRMRLRRTI